MAGQPITSLERLQQGLLGGLGLAGDPVQAPLQLPAAPQGVGLATPAPPPQAAAVAPPAPAAAPAAGMGMGLAQAPQGATDPTAGALGPAPTDLSDLPAIQKALLLFGELGNALQNPGTAGPAQQMLARRKQEYESKRKAFADGVQVLEQFRSVLDRTPAKDLDKVHAQLKARWAQLAPGMEALFDATLGDPKDVAASLQPVLDDEGGKALFASGRTVQELGQYYASPEVQKRLRAEADAKTFAPAKQKLQDLLATKDPRIQKILKDAQGADGVWTLDEIRAVNEQLPESLRLSNSELVTLDRNEVGLNDLGRNFRTREAIALETQEQIKSDVDERRQKRIEAFKASLEKEKGPAPLTSTEVTRKVEQFNGLSARFRLGREGYDKLRAAYEQALEAQKRGDNSGVSDVFLVRAAMVANEPNSAVTGGEVSTLEEAQRNLGNLAAAKIYMKAVNKGILTPEERKAIYDVAKRGYQGNVARQEELEDQYRANIVRGGGDPREVPDHIGADRAEFGRKPTGEGAPPEATAQALGDEGAAIRAAFKAGTISRDEALRRLEALENGAR